MTKLITGEQGLQLIKSFEKLYLRPYDDKFPKSNLANPAYKIMGKLTGGWGHTGDDVTRDMIISLEQAESWLASDLHKAEAIVSRLIKIDLTQNQFDACVSFAFNSGGGYISKDSGKWTPYELWGYINTGKSKEEITAKWKTTAVTSGGMHMAGLENRRAKEVELFFL